MSIADNLNRIKTAKEAIKTAINNKGGGLTNEKIEAYATAIDNLKLNDDTDYTGVNVTVNDMLEGIIAIDATGNKITGNIKTVTPTLSENVIEIEKGYIADATTLAVPEMEIINDGQTVFIPVGYNKTEQSISIKNGIDTSDANATSYDIVEGKSAYVKGEKVYGMIPDKTNTVQFNYNEVTIDAGFYNSSKTYTIGTKYNGEIIVPGTTDKTIPAYSYLMDNVVVKGDANLKEDIIKEGETLFGITGTYKGAGGDNTSSMDFFKCAAVYGPYDVETVVISGCPTAEINGEYIPTEFTTEDWEGNKNPVYKHATANYYYFYEPNNWWTWGIGTDYTSDTLLYRGTVGSSYWEDTDWNTVDGMTGVYGEATLDTDVPKTWDGYKAVLNNGVYSFESEVTTGLTYTNLKPEKYRIYSADAAVKIDWIPEDLPTANLILFAPLTSDLDNAEIGGAIKHSKTSELGTLDNTDCTVFTNSNDGIYIDCDGIIGTGELTMFLQFAVSSFNQGIIFNIGSSFSLSPVDNNNQKLRFNNDAAYTQTIEQNQWYTVLLVRRKKGELSLFFDGEFKHKYTFNGNILQTLQLGHNWFFGGIRNVLIYNRALSETEIDQIIDKFGFTPKIIVKTPVALTAYLENEITKQLAATVKNDTGETLTFSSSNMPAGLTLSSDGRITGTPTTIGSVTSTVTLSYPGADNVQITINWEIKEASAKPIVSEDLVFYAPLRESKTTAETDQQLSTNGDATYSTIDGVACVSLPYGSYISISPSDNLPTGNADRTLACWAKTSSNNSDRYALIGYGPEQQGKAFYMEMRNNTVAVCGAQSASNESYGSKTIDVSQWHHYALVYSAGVVKFYLDGEACGTFQYKYDTYNSQALIGILADRLTGRNEKQIASARIYSRALTDSEITELANEFNQDEPDVPDTPDTPTDKAYVYTVSGAGTAAANGNYYLTDKTIDGNPVYTNGACYMWGNVIDDDLDVGNLHLYTEQSSGNLLGNYWTVDFGEYPEPIVTEYAGGQTGNSSSSDAPDDSDKTYVYTVSGAGTEKVNGDYWDSGEVYDGIPVYTNGTCEMFGNQMSFHGITDEPGYRGEAMILYHAPSFTSGWTINEGASPAPTVTTYEGGDSGSGNSPATRNYVCTMTGCVVEGVNGDYWDSGETFDYSGTNVKKYVNESGFYFGGLEYSSSIYLHDSNNVLLYESTNGSDISNYYGTTLGDMGGGSPGPTVIAYTGGSNDDSDSATYVYTATNAGTTKVNGNYRLVTADERANKTIGNYTNITIPSDNNDCKYTYWTNGECLLCLGEAISDLMDGNYWSIAGLSDGELYYEHMGDGTKPTTPVDVSWSTYMGKSPVPTFTEYTPQKTEPAHDYIVTVVGIDDDVAGNYYDSELTSDSLPIYVHENGKYYILHVGDYWRLMSVESYNGDFVWFDQVYNYDNLFGQTQGGRMVAPYGFELQYKYQATGHGDCEGRYYQHFEEQNGKPVYIQQHRFGPDSSYKTIKWSGDYWVITTMGGDVMGHSTGADITGDWIDEFGDTLLTIVEI